MAAALLQSFGLNAMATLWHLPLAGGCPAAIIWPQHHSNPVAFTSGHIAMVTALLQSFGLNAGCIRPFCRSPF